MAEWRGGEQASAARSAPLLTGHVGLGPGLVDEDQPVWIDITLVALPSLALALDIRTFLLGGAQSFF
jgi:hypothetical protein